MRTKTKKLLAFLLVIGACNSIDASIKWKEECSDTPGTEMYDFEVGGLYYGIISETRGEVHVMNPNVMLDPIPPYWEIEVPPSYRFMVSHSGQDWYRWEGRYYEGDVEIPAEVEYKGKMYKVVRIAYGAFAWCDKLTSIKLPPTIREIRYGAFSMCTSLKEMNVPSGTKICGGAFYGCISLESLDLSGCSFQYYPDIVYDAVVCYCSSLEKVYLPATYGLESFSCYALLYKNPMIEDDPGSIWHTVLGDYYLDYDDFPFRDKRCDHEDGYYTEGMMAVTERSIAEPDNEDTPIWDQHTCMYELDFCNMLREIHVATLIPPVLIRKSYTTGWEHLYENCVLYVPQGSLEAYRNAEPWMYFKNIVEEEGTSGLEEAVPDVDAPADGERRIYDLSGRLRATVPAGKTPTLAPGLYIERTSTSSRKLRIP